MAITDNIRAAYNLEDVNDGSGNGYTLTNSNTVTFTSGKIGNAATFGSGNTNKKLNVASGLGIINTDDFTISWWFTTTNAGAISSPIRFIYDSGTRDIIYIYDGANARHAVWTGNFATFNSGGDTLASNTWYHMVMECSAGTITVYRDTVSKMTIANTSRTGGTDDLSIGEANTWYDIGQIDATYVWNRAIGSTDRSTMYNSGTGYELSFGGGGSTRKGLALLGVGQ